MLSVPQVPHTTASCGFSATPDGMYICAVRPISTHAAKTKHVHMAGWYISDIYMICLMVTRPAGELKGICVCARLSGWQPRDHLDV